MMSALYDVCTVGAAASSTGQKVSLPGNLHASQDADKTRANRQKLHALIRATKEKTGDGTEQKWGVTLEKAV
jgi:hypothetical protein